VRRATPAEPVPIENHCAKAGKFFACNQFVNGKNMALVIFLPLHPLEIVGDRWVYSSDQGTEEKRIYGCTINVFSSQTCGLFRLYDAARRPVHGSLRRCLALSFL
jgi:hypothetical protein